MLLSGEAFTAICTKDHVDNGTISEIHEKEGLEQKFLRNNNTLANEQLPTTKLLTPWHLPRLYACTANGKVKKKQTWKLQKPNEALKFKYQGRPKRE